MDARSHAPQLPRSCTYQPPSAAGVRLAAVRLLGRAVALLAHDTAQQSAGAKTRPRACAGSLPRSQDPQCSPSCANTARSLQMQVRTARSAAPERLAGKSVKSVKSVKSLCRALAVVPESLLAELPCHALARPLPCPSSSCAFKQILKQIPILLPRARQSPIVHAS